MPNDTIAQTETTVIHIKTVHVLMALIVILALVPGGWYMAQMLQPAPVLATPQAVPVTANPLLTLQGVTSDPPVVGKVAPDFVLNDLNGQPLTLSSLRGKAVLVNFWATWCPPCRFEMPALIEVYNRYKDQGFEIVAVDIAGDNGPEAVKSFVKEFGMNFPVVLDTLRQAELNYRVRAYPTSVFIDREGKITTIYTGAMPKSFIESKVKEIL